MKIIFTKLRRVLLVLLMLGFATAEAQQLAFPGAEGFGRFTTGGRGGKVMKVTNLNDSGPGSLRAAIMEAGARTIVFTVSGNIKLTSRLNITNGNLTIAGQTAPGDGITLQNYEMVIGADNVIIRYLRFRMGDLTGNQQDAIWGRYQKNIIIDHCSMSWSIDECSSFYANQNFTMQWCLLSESLNRSAHDKNDHGYGGIWGGDKATFHHNLLAHHNSRNPRFNGYRSGVSNGKYPNEHVDYRNNVVYNWLGNSSYGGENGNYNIVNNYYKPGPATPSSRNKRIMQISFESNASLGVGYGKFFIDGNYVAGNPTVTADNWNGGVDYDSKVPAAARPSGVKLTEPIAYEMETQHTAQQAYEAVLEKVGASLKRDAVDVRVIEEVRTGTATFTGSRTGYKGILDSQTDVGSWPELASLPAPADADNDGMPDAWELAQGLDPNNANDRNTVGQDGYTNLEVYLDWLIEEGITTSSSVEKAALETAAYPNPFSDKITFTFDTKQKEHVRVTILDLSGKVVATLLDDQLRPGAYEVVWAGTDSKGRRLTSGMYLYSLQIGKEQTVKRVALIR
ncbi:T9SS type A sorting domain-containing protein [Pontibacter beigongshangensis]|uniref:T9SS type A sorting domain-containing protein n=1 Tax=Pontibacter beigongshangensis TaxID=2574733 RepID=UPI00164F890E|nr:T9SS type A sorting domain-containing protein [Pontibacter beigongshangensis]